MAEKDLLVIEKFQEVVGMQFGGTTACLNSDSADNIFSVTKNKNFIETLRNGFPDDIMLLNDFAAKLENMRRQELLLKHMQKIWQGNNGDYYTHIYIDGRRVLRHRKTKGELEDWLVNYYAKQEEQVFIRDVFERWIESKLRYGEIQKQSYDRYRTDYDRFFPEKKDICKKQFKYITGHDIEKFVKETICDMQLTRKMYNGLAILINGIFKFGKKEGLTELSITQVMGDMDLSDRIFVPKVQKKEEETFSEEETSKVIEYFQANPDIWNLGLYLMFQTGMRVGELTALKKEDICQDIINVRRTEYKYKDDDGKSHVGVKDYPKTTAGYREIILPARAKDTIKHILHLNPNGEYLMENGKGQRIRGTTLTRRITIVCKKLGLIHHSCHKIRKTYGTLLLDGNVSDSLVASQMGHKSVSTTRALYYYSNKSRETNKKQIVSAILL